MKRNLAIIYFCLTVVFYACEPYFANHYNDVFGENTNKENVIFYTDVDKKFEKDIIFLKDGNLYVYGKKFLKVNPKNYLYINYGYYENNGSIYYYNRKISDYTDNDRIKTYRGFFRNGYSNETYVKSLTDCGDFTTQIVEDYLILGNKLYKNGELVIKK